MALQLSSGRDRSGRVPRASRDHAFYQAVDDWSSPGKMPEAVPPANATMQQNYTVDDQARGNGY